ncbi:putative peptidase M23 [Brevibacillus phage SecTim467]|uniref:Putative peptidase M23 n=2 Tax=Jenstvirus jenst TaxID=1982225 RepID=A0A0K2CNY2_9CAUD|nr:putative peptidase M23 [Brevibacillus phage Jenst]ALA07168.1 putative peptidase M23 [Brevibacillus phage Jenst]ALA07537.1 putative peptidase M23 [Brevibacillus phage SecTim467]
MYVSDYNYPSGRLLDNIMERINALGNEPRVIIELDKMSYVRGLRRRYDAVQYVYDSVVTDLLSIDKAEKLTDYVTGQYLTFPTELRNANMSLPILSSSTMNGVKEDDKHISGIRITDWHDSDPRCSRKVHKGIDLDLAIGDPVYAVWSGVVKIATFQRGYGNVVYIDHGNGWETRYAHLSQISVNRGDRVEAGRMVGLGGNSGITIKGSGGDGSHLHFEVRLNGNDLNPEPFLRKKRAIQTPSKSPTKMLGTIQDGDGTVMQDGTSYVEYSMEATAYVATCPGCSGITRGGTDVRQWSNWRIIAVDPSVIPLKSKVELVVDGVSWGEYLADDTGGDIKGRRIDVLMETKQKAFEFGRKSVIVRVKSWGDGKSRTTSGEIDKEIVTYQVNRTTTKQTFYKDFSAKKTGIDIKKFTDMTGAEQFTMYETKNSFMNVLGFQGTGGAGQVKKIVFEHDWFKGGNLAWAYNADLEIDDVVTIKVDDYVITQIKGVNAKSGVAYPPSIPIPKGHHKIEFSLANPSKASTGKLGILWLRAKEFDVETVEQKQVWDFEDTMNSMNNWTPYGTVSQVDRGDYQAISTKGGEAGVERLNKIKKFPFTMNFRVRVDAGTTGRIYLGDGKKCFQIQVKEDGIATQGGGVYSRDNKSDFVEYTVVCHDDTDMDVYVKNKDSKGNDKWENTGVRGVGYVYQTSRILFAVGAGTMYLDSVRYSFNNYAVEQFASHLSNSYNEKWYEVGSFEFEEMFTLDKDIMAWEVNSHMDMSSSTARITLNNATGIYSPMWERRPEFPDTYKVMQSPLSYWEEGELRHVLSEGTPVRIYAGYGNEMVRVFTGMIKGEIEENAEARTIAFSCVDRFDMIEEFVFYKPMSYPPAEAYAGDGGAYAWLKSSIVEDIVIQSGLTSWKIHADDFVHNDYEIDDTTYIDVNRGKNTFMKFNKTTGDLEAVTQESIKTVGGWENPFVASVTFPLGTRASDAIQSLIQDMPYHVYCDRYGTFKMRRLNFLDTPDWAIKQGASWEFIDGENLLELTSSTDYSRVRNHLIIYGKTGLAEHFFDRGLLVATKGNIRTSGIMLDWIEEVDGATMRGLKEEIANKIFFDMKRQARTKNVVVKGNPLIELLDAVYVYDRNTYTADYYLVKGNRLVGSEKGMVNYLELTWQTLSQPS